MTQADIERRRLALDQTWLRLIGFWRGNKSDMASYSVRRLERSRRLWNEACAMVAAGQWPKEVIQ